MPTPSTINGDPCGACNDNDNCEVDVAVDSSEDETGAFKHL